MIQRLFGRQSEHQLKPCVWALPLLAALPLLLRPAPAQAADDPSNFTFRTNGPTLSITRYVGTSPTVNIPANAFGMDVTEVGSMAFAGQQTVTAVQLPEGIQNIGYAAFQDCISLKEIVLPSTVTNLEDAAFEDCHALGQVTFDAGLTTIGMNAFQYCGSLTNVGTQDGLASIADRAFGDCTNLPTISIPATVTNINGAAFQNCFWLTNFVVSPGLSAISQQMFINCLRLSTINIPTNITSIGISAFENCTALTNVSFESGLTNIGSSAFNLCGGLKNLTLPETLDNIGNYAFATCSSMQSLCFQGNAPGTVGQDLFLYDNTTNITVFYVATASGWGTNFAGVKAEACTQCGVLPESGSLTVSILPTQAVTDGALWKVDGGDWLTNNAVVTNLTVGDHLIEYSAPAAWIPPSSQHVSLTNGILTTVTATFQLMPVGALKVTLRPAAALAAGAEWQVDHGAWQTSGTVLTDVEAGSHVLTFKAASGWISPEDLTVYVHSNHTASATATYTIAPVTPTVTVIGNGTVTTSYGSHDVKPGQHYTLTAKPALGNIFTGWTGSVTSSTPKLSLVGEAGQSFQANFMANPLLLAAGTYQGLFVDTNDLAPEKAGSITFSSLSSGSYSAKLLLAGKSLSLSGKLSLAGSATNIATLNKTNPLMVTLQLDLNGNWLTGSVAGLDWSVPVSAYRTTYSKQNPWTQSTKYTLLLPGSTDSSTQPGGESYGSLTVSSTGSAKIKGVLADGVPFSASAALCRSNQWAFYASPYRGKGMLLGWLTFTNEPDSDLSGQINWLKQQQKSASYTEGFGLQTEAVGSAFALSDKKVLSFGSGEVALTEGGLEQDYSILFQLNNNKVTTTNKSMTLTLNPSTGFFTGSATPADAKLSVKGAVLQKQSLGYGFFLNEGQSGRVVLSALPQ